MLEREPIQPQIASIRNHWRVRRRWRLRCVGGVSMIKKRLISAGVKNLHDYGYPNCNVENITQDEIYKAFFVSMLKQNKGVRRDIDEAINELIAECGESA